MNQSSWTYRDRFGTNHIVGVMHGAESGHLMIHWNNSVIQIDFDVFEQKRYNVFIGDELCFVELKPNEQNNFDYTFKIDRETSTPLNEKRKEAKQKEEKYDKVLLVVLAVVGFCLLVVLFVVLLLKWKRGF